MGMRKNLFTRLNVMLAVVFLVIVVFYSYSHQKTVSVLNGEIQQSNRIQLSLLSADMEYKIGQMVTFLMSLLNDSNVKKFAFIPPGSVNYDHVEIRRTLMDKLSFQENSLPKWSSSYAIYSTYNKMAVSTSGKVAYDSEYLKRNIKMKWELRKNEYKPDERAFYYYMSDTIIHPNKLADAAILIEGLFPEQDIRIILDEVKNNGRGDPFLYQPQGQAILSTRSNQQLTQQLIAQLNKQTLQTPTFQQLMTLDGQKYAVTGVLSPSLHWYLIDYVPLAEVMAPISVVKGLFYAALFLLFVLCIVFSYMLHQNVLKPLKWLIGGLQSVSRGNYAVQLNWRKDYEFSYVFTQFNRMSSRIKELIEDVYKAQLRMKDAQLKQLQAQINPHFLYNCLGFIINMAQMKKEQAVVAMAHNMSVYYRYMTRSDVEEVSLQEELDLVRSYLEIQRLRFPRLQYVIEIPEALQELRLPRLLLQPIVENSMVHGIGNSIRSNQLRVTGFADEERFTLIVEDDGNGLSDGQLQTLSSALQIAEQSSVGYGLWNVAQRLQQRFNGQAILTLQHSELGGLAVTLTWEIKTLHQRMRKK